MQQLLRTDNPHPGQFRNGKEPTKAAFRFWEAAWGDLMLFHRRHDMNPTPAKSRINIARVRVWGGPLEGEMM